MQIASYSVREVTGIHATQPTTASKPILRRGAVNLLTYSQDFTNAAWVKTGILSATVGQVDSVGGTGATLFIESTATSFHRTFQQPFTYLPATAYTLAVLVKDAGTRYCNLMAYEGATGAKVYIANFDLQNGTVHSSGVTSGGVVPTSGIVAVGGGYYLLTLNYATTTAGASGAALFMLNRANIFVTGGNEPTYTGDGVSGAYVHRMAVIQGTYTAAQIQALGGIPLTTTAPASTALGAHFWAFDGSNDSLSLGGPLFQMADDHCVVAGVSPQSGATKVVVSPSFESASNFAGVIAFTSAGKVFANWCGAAISGQATDPATLLNTSVATARKTGNTKVLHINGVFKASDATLVTTSAASTAAYLGSFGGSSLYSNGSIYPVIAIKGTVTDPELLLLEKLVAQLSGITL